MLGSYTLQPRGPRAPTEVMLVLYPVTFSLPSLRFSTLLTQGNRQTFATQPHVWLSFSSLGIARALPKKL